MNKVVKKRLPMSTYIVRMFFLFETVMSDRTTKRNYGLKLVMIFTIFTSIKIAVRSVKFINNCILRNLLIDRFIYWSDMSVYNSIEQ